MHKLTSLQAPRPPYKLTHDQMINNCKNIPRKVVLVLVCRTKTNALRCVSPLSKQLWYELCASKQTGPHRSEVKGLNKYRQGLSVPYTFDALIRVYILILFHYFHGKKLMTNLFEEKIKTFLMNVRKTFYYDITVVKNGKFGTPEGAWFMWMTISYNSNPDDQNGITYK